MLGAPAVTVNVPGADSEPVLIWMVRAPSAAPMVIWSCTVAWVGLLTVTAPATISEVLLNEAVVRPCVNVVNWPVIVIEGSGRLADDVAGLKKEPSQIEDPALAEIVEEGDLRVFPINGALEDFERMLFSQSPNIKLLDDAR